MQETWVQSLIQEDPMCLGAAKTVRPDNEPMLQSPGAEAREAAPQEAPLPRGGETPALHS